MADEVHHIVGARWTPQRNMLSIRCDDSPEAPPYEVPADRWRYRCPHCHRQGFIVQARRHLDL